MTNRPPKNSVILVSVLFVLLLAVCVCVLHVVNATAVHGYAELTNYAVYGPPKPEENCGFLPIVENIEEKKGILQISGALMRFVQETGVFNVRVGMVQENTDKVLLLNTQMVRRPELANQYGCDDHCGFVAAVRTKTVFDSNQRYAVVLVDESTKDKKWFETGVQLSVDTNGNVNVIRAAGGTL